MRAPNGASSASASRRAAATASSIELPAAACIKPTIELGEAVENRGARVPARLLRLAREPIDLREQRLDVLLEAGDRRARAAHEPRNDPLEMRGERRLRAAGAARFRRGLPCTMPTERRQSSKRSRMSASQNSMRTGRRLRAACLQALAVSIDAAERNRQRHAALGPAAHLLERRADDAHQMAAVLPTEIDFELAAVFGEIPSCVQMLC